MSHTDQTRRRWAQARRVLKWRVGDTGRRRRQVLVALRARTPQPPQCLLVVTPTGGRRHSTHVAMGETHWSLLQGMDKAVEQAAPCIVSAHDLDETDLDGGLLALLALDAEGLPAPLPPEMRAR